jgi:hypothetical protein
MNPPHSKHGSTRSPGPPPAQAEWIAHQRASGQTPTSPATNLPLHTLELLPNRTVRSLAAAMLASGWTG